MEQEEEDSLGTYAVRFEDCVIKASLPVGRSIQDVKREIEKLCETPLEEAVLWSENRRLLGSLTAPPGSVLVVKESDSHALLPSGLLPEQGQFESVGDAKWIWRWSSIYLLLLLVYILSFVSILVVYLVQLEESTGDLSMLLGAVFLLIPITISLWTGVRQLGNGLTFVYAQTPGKKLSILYRYEGFMYFACLVQTVIVMGSFLYTSKSFGRTIQELILSVGLILGISIERVRKRLIKLLLPSM